MGTVEHAVIAQTAMAQCNVDLRQDRLIDYRSGLKFGDDIVDEGDAFERFLLPVVSLERQDLAANRFAASCADPADYCKET